MIAYCKRTLAVLLILTLSLASVPKARADVGPVGDAKAAGVILAAVGVGLLIAAVVYYEVHHNHTLKGCIAAGAGGSFVLNDGSGHTYALSGNVDRLKAGERVRLAGVKRRGGGSNRQFVVARLANDYGPCPATP